MKGGEIINSKFKIQNLTLVLIALSFATVVLCFSVVNALAFTPQKNVRSGPTVIPTAILTPTPAKVDYFLAYPGILPDKFLYPIKMIRDRIWLFLTTEPSKRAEVLLLFADKRLVAGKALVEGGKEELGINTLSKAEKYLERAIVQEKIAREKGKDTAAFLEKLGKAALKHEEVLLELGQKASEVGKAAIKEILRYSQQGYEEVRQRLGK